MEPNNTKPKSTLNLRGILLPFTTPFTAQETVDTEAVRANIRNWNKRGVAGYVALGSTGERVNVSEREYVEIIEAARGEVPEQLTFIAGAGQQSTRQTINEVKRAAAVGADAVLVLTPHFYRSAITPEALVAHYTSVADASPVPVILYSMPDLTGVVIEPETVARLSEHPNIIGIKDSSSDVTRFKETVSLVSADFEVLTGNGTVLHPALCAGARGAVLAVGCAVPETCIEIYHYTLSGNHDYAASLQDKLTPLALAVTKRYGIGGLKAAMDLVGLNGGFVRAPLRAPASEARQEIANLLSAVAAIQSKDPAGFAGALTT